MPRLPKFNLYLKDIHNKTSFTVGFFEIISRFGNIVYQSLH